MQPESNEKQINNFLKGVCVVMLLIAALGSNQEYGFFTLLRLFVFSISLYLGIYYQKRDLKSAALVLFAISILFNPLIPVQLERSTWKLFDFATAAAFIYFIGEDA